MDGARPGEAGVGFKDGMRHAPRVFDDLGVPAPVRDALEAMGYHEPTPVQRAAIPVLLSGRDALVEAQTGSGKTAAYGVPAVVVGARGRGVRVLVLVPTRELARQVTAELREIGTGSGFRAIALTGGLSEEQEERQLAGDVRCVVATPGRLLAVMEAGKLQLRAVELVVLDEADRMLDLGFRPDVERVLEATSARRHAALFSATLPPGVIRLAAVHLREPADVRVGETPTPASLEHFRLNIMPGQKEAALVALLRKEAPERAMVFVRTRERATAFTRLLKDAGVAADQLQGKMTHDQRRHVFDLFSRGVSRVLVATDLASRGLDVPEMELVVNVDLPDEDETYLHRAGRAARMGRPGRVVSFVLPDEKPRRVTFERIASVEFTPYRLEFSEADLPAPREAPEPRGAKRTGAKGASAKGAKPAGARASRTRAEGAKARDGHQRPQGGKGRGARGPGRR